MRSADFRFKNVFGRRIRRKLALHSRILLASTELMHRLTSDSSLHFNIQSTHQIRMQKLNASARRLFLQPCSSDGRRFTASSSRLNYFQNIVSFPPERI